MLKSKICKLKINTQTKVTAVALPLMLAASNVFAIDPVSNIFYDSLIKSSIEKGFADAIGMVKELTLIGVPATIAVIALSKGAKYGIRWVSSLFSKA